MKMRGDPCDQCVELSESVAGWNEENAGTGEWPDLNALLRAHDEIELRARRDVGTESDYLLYHCTMCRHWWILHFDEESLYLGIEPAGPHLVVEWQGDD